MHRFPSYSFPYYEIIGISLVAGHSMLITQPPACAFSLHIVTNNKGKGTKTENYGGRVLPQFLFQG